VEFSDVFLSTAILRRRAGEGSFDGKSTDIFVLVTCGVESGMPVDMSLSAGEAALSRLFNAVDSCCMDSVCSRFGLVFIAGVVGRLSGVASSSSLEAILFDPPAMAFTDTGVNNCAIG